MRLSGRSDAPLSRVRHGRLRLGRPAPKPSYRNPKHSSSVSHYHSSATSLPDGPSDLYGQVRRIVMLPTAQDRPASRLPAITRV